ncbi:MAG: carbamoyl phosphate synthase large subunit [Omnitrophica bacterium RIFCSPHIGHO2_02_FULL_51_18]|nr:MAG: carbamoyl phosphate synthase large subunit [Omnitrophica bacterium RIFCSPHIGHO2_02_FULL_51_18]
MPKRTDIHKILIIGSGPIIIGQACEFDYSGTQACKALREEGYEVVLINSNPATIMTDPQTAERTYIEPITVEYLEKIIKAERPDAVLPTLGGQTGLNTAVKAAEAGLFKKYGVQMIGVNLEAIKKGENRELFKKAMQKIGIGLPQSGLAHTLAEAKSVLKKIGLPVVVRPSFTLGGTGGGIANTKEEFEKMAAYGIQLSMTHEILIEESIFGWKEFELEVMRDKKDNVVIICSIENFDPMGVHTGDSITVAPIQTLTDVEYQKMRDAAIACIREIGVETGGSNIQFALNPKNGCMVIIEMNPRVSRSSALASKATGFPIAKIAAKLAVGYTLDEIPNDITKKTPASFEPMIDYCVVKIPRFAFEKFPGADTTLTTQMKSVGEVMAIGRTFKEALQKGLRGLEVKAAGFESKKATGDLKEHLKRPNAERLYYLKRAIEEGMNLKEIHKLTFIDPWFLENLKEIVEFERELRELAAGIFKLSFRGRSPRNLIKSCDEISRPAKIHGGPRDDARDWTASLTSFARNDISRALRRAKELGFSDAQLGEIFGKSEIEMRAYRKKLGILPTYKLVDTCAAEFEAFTPYYYSTYEMEDEVKTTSKKKIMILGGGPNRIGQGIEFDYCCCHASFALKEIGFETIMVNCNPETVSTDYDTSDRLYFEPVTFEDVMNIVEKEKPDGVIVQFGGQTPLNLALSLYQAGVPIIGTSPQAIDRAEDRKKFAEVLRNLGLKQPENGTAVTLAEALKEANRIGYPVLVRPSYVLGGRAMEIVYDEPSLINYMQKMAVDVSKDRPILVDKFLEGATEIDVDMIADGETYVVAGVMEHIEQAGIHSGDSACCLPPHNLAESVIQEIKKQTAALAKELNVVGLMNVQFAVKNGVVYVLEVNPRASRTVPFVSKAIGVPLAKLASKVMAGKKLKELGFMKEIIPSYRSVKEVVLPFVRFRGVDILLGPEMKSTGEVMGIADDFGTAFAKAQEAANSSLPLKGTIFLSVKDKDKRAVLAIAKELSKMKFSLVATAGTAKVIEAAGIRVRSLKRISEGSPNVVDLMKEKKIDLVINTPAGEKPRKDEIVIRSFAVSRGIPCVTTMEGALASLKGIQALKIKDTSICSIQDYHKRLKDMSFRAKREISSTVTRL